MSLEGAVDIVVDGVPHGDDATHQVEFGHPLEAHEGESSNTELDGEHCEHCCHGHTAGVTGQVAAIKTAFAKGDHKPARSPHVRSFAQAPPTPPPNA